MARKKIVFVIVEGPSDDTALGAILTKIYDQNMVFIKIMRCDITTEPGVRPENIVSKVGDIIRNYATNNSYKKIHFQQIIHIVDTDGAFISDDSIVEDLQAATPLHFDTEIRTKNKAGIEERNRQKRGNIVKLVSTKEIWNIPYAVFYMSCNLDHALYNKRNTSDEEKEDDAYRFALQYECNVQGFLSLISDSEFSVMTGYKESWEFIKADLHSLQRHCNLGLCFSADLVSKE